MKVNIYATQFSPRYTDTLVWSGDMSCVPRVDDLVFFFEGWGGARVTRTYWDLEKQEVELFVDDRDGSYTREAEKRNKGEDAQ